MMPSRILLLLSATLSLALISTAVVAEPRPGGDRLRIEQGEQRDISVPVRGMSMENVRDVYGAPREVKGPVGDPPITRWDYSGFSVYFEHHLVLHSVIPKNQD